MDERRLVRKTTEYIHASPKDGDLVMDVPRHGPVTTPDENYDNWSKTETNGANVHAY